MITLKPSPGLQKADRHQPGFRPADYGRYVTWAFSYDAPKAYTYAPTTRTNDPASLAD
jgi:hypothetical protein